MTDDIEPGGKHLPAPPRRRDTERALGLEVARLFGLNPRLLMAPPGVVSGPPEEKGENDDLSGDRPRGADGERPEP